MLLLWCSNAVASTHISQNAALGAAGRVGHSLIAAIYVILLNMWRDRTAWRYLLEVDPESIQQAKSSVHCGNML